MEELVYTSGGLFLDQHGNLWGHGMLPFPSYIGHQRVWWTTFNTPALISEYVALPQTIKRPDLSQTQFHLQTQNEVARIRAMVRNYVPQYDRNYSRYDISEPLLAEYINILRYRGFNFETAMNAALVTKDVGVGSINAMRRLGYQQVTHDRFQNLEFQIGFKDTADGVHVMIRFNGTDFEIMG